MSHELADMLTLRALWDRTRRHYPFTRAQVEPAGGTISAVEPIIDSDG